MSEDLLIPNPRSLASTGQNGVPALFTASGDKAVNRLLEFLTASIRNPNTRTAYGLAIRRFSAWAEHHLLQLEQLTPLHIAAYVEELGRPSDEPSAKPALAKPSVKQHLAAIRMLFDYLVIGQVVPFNPAASVRGPKYVIKKGKTPVLSQEEARTLFQAIDHKWDETGRLVQKADAEMTLAELRDRALIGVMVYSFARIGAVLAMNVEDYRQQGKRCALMLHEKGGKEHSVPAHHKIDEYLDAYLSAAGIAPQGGTPLFRTIDEHRQLTARRLTPREALAMVKRRSRAAGLGGHICCHTFRATGITVFLDKGGTVEKAMQIAAHESPRTTKLYDRTDDQLTLDEIERIQI